VNRSLAPLLSRTIPKWKVVWEYGPVAPGRLTSDKACEEAYFKTDKLIYHGALKVRWAWELLCATDTAIKEIGKIQHPLIIQHGTAPPGGRWADHNVLRQGAPLTRAPAKHRACVAATAGGVLCPRAKPAPRHRWLRNADGPGAHPHL